MVVFPGCKINIGLNIIAKRPDGYHGLESVFYPIGLTDVLEIVKSDAFEFKLTGIPVDGKEADNLVVKAYTKLNNTYTIGPVKIHLHKNVPLGAGLGGGSADASATLLLLNSLFNLNLSKDTLCTIAAELGSDCPYFIENTPAYVTGRGEVLTPIKLELKGYFIQLINPNIHIQTKEAFSAIPLSHSPNKIKQHLSANPQMWKNTIKNDFEETIFPKFPAIAQLKTQLYKNGALYASMTGTGASVYGIFKNKPKPSFPNYFEWIGEL